MILFDHIEVHVSNAEKYAVFLEKLFRYGRYKKISDNNTYMFIGPNDIHIEIKENIKFVHLNDSDINIGFCLPCLRMKGAKDHLTSLSEITIDSFIENPDGKCYFFTDYEKIKWHIKDYLIQDIYINI